MKTKQVVRVENLGGAMVVGGLTETVAVEQEPGEAEAKFADLCQAEVLRSVSSLLLCSWHLTHSRGFTELWRCRSSGWLEAHGWLLSPLPAQGCAPALREHAHCHRVRRPGRGCRPESPPVGTGR